MTGRFVVLEGGEGAGKSTQVAMLADWLRSTGREVVTTREPGATPVGERVRAALLDPALSPDPRTEALLYAADRAEHVARVVRPALARGAVVVSDRYVDSSVAYQAGGRGLPEADIVGLTAWGTGGLDPDLVVLLDVDPAVGLARAARRGAPDRLEQEAYAFHARVRATFLRRAAAGGDRCLVVAADRPAEAVAAAVRARVATLWTSGEDRDPAAPAH